MQHLRNWPLFVGLAWFAVSVQARDRSGPLLELAREEFGQLLPPSAEKLFKAIANGEVADYGDGDPAEADAWWSEDRVVKAEWIRWLCTDSEASKHAQEHAGVGIRGAILEGALRLDDASLRFPLVIRESRVLDKMTLVRARLRRLSLIGSHIRGLDASGAELGGIVSLRNGFRSEGEVRLVSAKIGGSLACIGGEFINPGGYSLDASGVEVGGSVLLREGFRSEGEVQLISAKIGGNLECTAGVFINPDGDSINADQVRVDGSVFLRHFQSEGRIDLTDGTVGSWFEFRSVKNPRQVVLDLESAHVGTLFDEARSWPPIILLDGFTYDHLSRRSPLTSDERLDWLTRADTPFTPQPYEQLARMLTAMGHEAEARTILIAKEKARLQVSSPLTRWARRVLLGWTIAYGHRPWQVLFCVIPIVVCGWFRFRHGRRQGWFIDTSEDLPEFDAFMYSVDTFFPITNFGQANGRVIKHRGLQVYLWIHTVAGWVLTSLLVAGLAGLVKG
ncbi:MAG: hypothetical protein AAF533_06605 [Acidobacteriota bacterium]